MATTATMASLAYRAAQRFGERPALTMLGGETLNFADIDARAGRYAGGLAHAGLRPGDRVVVYLPNSLDWIIAYHAIARLGAVFVPANILLSANEVAHIVADCGARAVVLTADAMQEPEIRASAGAGGRLCIVHGGKPDACGIAASQILDGEWLAPVAARPEDLFTIGYTSGTTGRPKGAMQSHRAVFDSIATTATIHVRSAEDIVLTALPFAHVYGNVVLNTAFVAGLHVVAMARFDAEQVLTAIGREAITLFEGVPTMYYQMLAHPAIDAADFSSLRCCTVGGQTMPVASLEEVARRFACPILELWGMTEVSGPAATHSPYWPVRHGSIGLPFPGLEVRIADLTDATADVADGTPGELCVRGPLVTMGYWNNPEATAASIDPQRWLATGDIAVQESDRYLSIVDRRKDMIITGGYNIYPAELEQVIATHPAVSMVAVASLPDAEKGELAKAFVVLRPGATCDAEALRLHCRARMAAYKVPKAFAFVDDLPKTSTGKILRRALRTAAPGFKRET